MIITLQYALNQAGVGLSAHGWEMLALNLKRAMKKGWLEGKIIEEQARNPDPYNGPAWLQVISLNSEVEALDVALLLHRQGYTVSDELLQFVSAADRTQFAPDPEAEKADLDALNAIRKERQLMALVLEAWASKQPNLRLNGRINASAIYEALAPSLSDESGRVKHGWSRTTVMDILGRILSGVSDDRDH